MVFGFKDNVVIILTVHIIVQILGDFLAVEYLIVINIIFDESIGCQLNKQRFDVFRRFVEVTAHRLEADRLIAGGLIYLVHRIERILVVGAEKFAHGCVIEEILGFEGGGALVGSASHRLEFHFAGGNIPRKRFCSDVHLVITVKERTAAHSVFRTRNQHL